MEEGQKPKAAYHALDYRFGNQNLAKKLARAKAAPWIPARSATASSKADFDTLAKLGQDRLEGRSIAEALSWREIGGDDDLLDVAIG